MPIRRGKKNVSLSENDTIIHNLDYVVEDEDPIMCCECRSQATIRKANSTCPSSEWLAPVAA